MRWVVWAWSLWILAPLVAQASSSLLHDGVHYSIDTWSSAEGLPQSSVIALTQTRDGYLWLGTLNGLVRFDGIRFTVFDEGNTPGLNSNRIVSLFEDSARNLWIGTETAGVCYLAAGAGRVHPIGFGEGSRDQRVVAMAEDGAGAVWLYAADGQLCRYRDGRAEVWTAPEETRRSLCRVLTADTSGKVWVGTDRQIAVIGPDAGTAKSAAGAGWPAVERDRVRVLDGLLAARDQRFWRLADGLIQKWNPFGVPDEMGEYPWRDQATRVSALCEDAKGRLVVGTLGAGMYWFDGNGQATRIGKKEGLAHDFVLSLLRDREGNLWVGTDGGGLNRLKRQAFAQVPAVRGTVAQSIAQDAAGGLWIGANSGGVTRLHDGLTQRFLTNLPVRAVLVDRSQRVWAGTWGAGLFEFKQGSFVRSAGPAAVQTAVSAMHQDRQGDLWFGTSMGLVRQHEGGWTVWTTRDGLSADDVRAIADDAEGGVWVGTAGGGLNYWKAGRFETFRKRAGALPSDDISALWLDAEGVLWVGTGSGLARWHQGRWQRLTTREGLISNSVGYVVEDGQGFLWIGSPGGLMRLPKKAVVPGADGSMPLVPCRVFGTQDGLPTRECTQGSQPGAMRAVDGRLWFPTVEGVVSVQPDQLGLNPFPPPVVIESIAIDGERRERDEVRAALRDGLRLAPGQERLEVQFTGLNLAAPDRARFKYRLDGHETGWTEVADTRVARYSSLAPRRYRFEVTACNEDGVWNEVPAVLSVWVLPPFWRTWWFLSSASLLLLGAIAGVVHYVFTQSLQRQLATLRQKEALEKERARIARDLHDQLGANLTQVSLLGEMVESDKDAPEEVEALGQQITKTARETTLALDEIVWAANPANDTLEGLVNYVCKYAQDYLRVAGLRYRLDIPAQLPPLAIPPEIRHHVFLAAKEAITNVVRHAQGTSASLRLHLQPGRFTLEIADDGCGVAHSPGRTGRNGMTNMRKRMEDIGGEFAVETLAEGGTSVRLTAPLAKA